MRLLFVLLFALAAPAVAQREAQALIGVTQAVALAERATRGAAVDAELDSRQGRLVYEIELIRDRALVQAVVDARTGRVADIGRRRIEGWWRGWFDRGWGRIARVARPLAPRLAALERHAGGEVRKVGFDSDERRALYEVEIETAAGVAQVRIDAATGQRLARRQEN